jgi:hypothetical protein
MKTRMRWTGAALACALLAGCSQPEARPVSKVEKRVASPPNIMQFYASPPEVEKGGRTLLCYGVENARTVWLSPPRQELTASHTRCVEAFPSATTKYTLTAEGEVGPAATKEVTVSVGPPAPPRAQIVEVTISSLSVRPGEPVSICYEVKNAASVSIEPIQYRGGPQSKGCTLVQPRETTTYTVTARGARNEDSERVTVKVQ